MTNDLRPRDLAARWNLSEGHLQNLRSYNAGPNYHKGPKGYVYYSLADIEAYEQAHRITPHASKENNQ